MYIGIDVGGTNIGAGIIDDSGNIVGEMIAPTRQDCDFEEIALDIIMLIHKLLNEKDINISSIKSIGVGVPGVVDIDRGIFVSAPNIKVNNYSIKDIFEKEFRVPIFVDNDAKCAALAEAVFGATSEFDNSIMITLGTGIGIGIIKNKKIYRGLGNSVWEIAHTVVKLNGEVCGCGRKGCWERYASTNALKRMAVEVIKENPDCLINKLSGGDVNKISGKHVFDAASQGDNIAIQLLNKYYINVAEGIINIINTLNPEAIVIGGSMSKQGERLLTPIREYIQQNVFCRNIPIPQLRIAKFGREAGIIGAAMLVR